MNTEKQNTARLVWGKASDGSITNTPNPHAGSSGLQLISTLVMKSLDILFSLLSIFVFASLFGAFFALDRLIRREYQCHRNFWEKDGRPIGMFFRPPESTYIRSAISFQLCAIFWLFRTPVWVETDSLAKSLLRRLRLYTVIWNVGCISLVSLFLVHTCFQ